MIALRLALIGLAFLAFAAAAVGISTPRVNLVALGLALWMFAMLVT